MEVKTSYEDMEIVDLSLGLVVFLSLTLQRSAAQNVPLTSGTSSLQNSSEGADGTIQTPEFDPAIDLSDDGTGSTVSSEAQVINRTLGGTPGTGVSAKSGKKAQSDRESQLRRAQPPQSATGEWREPVQR